MKRYLLNKLNAIFAIVGAGILGLWIVVAQGAGSATLTLSPNSGSRNINTNFTVTIYENSGSDTVNAVQADLNYDSSKLQFVNLDFGNSAFDLAIVGSGGGGNVTIQRAKTGAPLAGSQIVAKITFKALVGSGTASVTFAGSSVLYRSTDNADIWNHNSTGATYSFTKPKAKPKPTAPSSSSNTTPTNENPSSNTTTSTASTPNVEEQKAKPSKPVTVSPSTSATSGYLVAVKVLDSNNQAVEGATVTLDGKTATSDATGIAGFVGVKSGEHEITAESDKGSVKGIIVVSDNKSPSEVQQISLNLASKNPLLLPLKITSGLVLLVGLGYIVLRLLKRFRFRKLSSSEPERVVSSSTIVTNPSAMPQSPESPDKPGTIITPTDKDQPKI